MSADVSVLVPRQDHGHRHGGVASGGEPSWGEQKESQRCGKKKPFSAGNESKRKKITTNLENMDLKKKRPECARMCQSVSSIFEAQWVILWALPIPHETWTCGYWCLALKIFPVVSCAFSGNDRSPRTQKNPPHFVGSTIYKLNNHPFFRLTKAADITKICLWLSNTSSKRYTSATDGKSMKVLKYQQQTWRKKGWCCR